jgi:glutamine cyclotransferase
MKKIFFLLLVLAFSLNGCKNGDKNDEKTNDVQPKGPYSMSFSIIATFPHDTSRFTQGLTIYKGSMYEGTGNYGHSKLLKVDWKTGKVEKEISLDPNYFGEGITVLRDTIYQLTYKEHKVFAYTLNDFRKVREFSINTEGWGITTDGKELIVSDGGSNLFYYEPSTFKLLRTQGVTEAGSLSFNLNELEFINGFVYANQWQEPYIFKIEPASGQIVGKSDLSAMWNRIKAIDPDADVPNGIAYDTASKKIFITGKKWPELYEIQFAQ